MPREESFLFPRFTLLNKLLREEIFNAEEDWRKAKTSEAKTNSIILILQGRTEFCILLQLYTRIRSNDRSQESSSPNFL